MNRELIFQTLFDVTQNLTWGADPAKQRTFKTRTRRIKLFSDVPATEQPWFGQAEHDEQTSQQSNLPYKWILKANWIVYQCVGNDPLAVPATENNLILDALQTALKPTPQDEGFPKRNTLGGLVHHCYFDGSVFKDPGDIDNQGMMVLPIFMLVPE